MANTNHTRRQLVRLAMSAPFLTPEEEYNLALSWRDNKDQQALDRICLAHLRLVLAISAKYRHFGLNMNDLVQEANIGLLEAANRFDPNRQVRFSTYATWWIRASIQEFILRNWSIVRGGTSSAQKTLFFSLRRLRAQLAQETNFRLQSDNYNEIALKLGVSIEDVEIMDSRLSSPDTSLNSPIVNDDGSQIERQDLLICNQMLQDEFVEKKIDGERNRSRLRKAMEILDEREYDIIAKRRLAENRTTLETLGKMYGISKERVRQIECKALKKLKEKFKKQNSSAD